MINKDGKKRQYRQYSTARGKVTRICVHYTHTHTLTRLGNVKQDLKIAAKWKLSRYVHSKDPTARGVNPIGP